MTTYLFTFAIKGDLSLTDMWAINDRLYRNAMDTVENELCPHFKVRPAYDNELRELASDDSLPFIPAVVSVTH